MRIRCASADASAWPTLVVTVCLPLFRVNNYNLAVQGWDLDEGVEHGPAEVGGRDDLNRCNNALNQMVVDLDSSVLDRDPAAAAVLRAPTSNDAGLNKPGLVLTGNGKKLSHLSAHWRRVILKT